jgi:hypothetical protein
MNVTLILVAMLAPVLILSMDSIASVRLDLQVGNSFWLSHVLCLLHVYASLCPMTVCVSQYGLMLSSLQNKMF